MLDESLKRLTKGQYLRRIGRRPIEGDGAGSGQYVYGLGKNGWDFCRFDVAYSPRRRVDLHDLGIADAFVLLKREEQADKLQVFMYETEPDTHVKMGGQKLTPDLLVTLRLADSRHAVLALEIDMGTESKTKIADKLKRYRKAYETATDQELRAFPIVLFLVPDELRKRVIEKWIALEKEESQDLYRVRLAHDFLDVLN